MITTTQAQQYDIVVPHCCLLGEGPVWDEQTGSICWIDLLNGRIHEYTHATNLFRTLAVNDLIGAVALCENGDFIAGLKEGLMIVNRNNGTTRLLQHPEAHLPQNRYNDSKCDPMGRFWIGSTSLNNTVKAGNLYTLNNDLTCAVAIKGVTMSNGMAWSPDNKTFYYIDTPTFEVAAFDYDIETGQISNKRIAFTIPRTEGLPDGMTIDSEGMLWIAHWDGWQVARWNPDSGRKLFSFRLPAAFITSCTFGGDELQDLYITSACAGLSEKQHEEQPLAGSLFVIRNCGFKGMKPAIFRYP